MEVKVSVTPEHVNEAVAAAVVQSQIGQALEDQLNSFLNDKSFGGQRLSDAMQTAVLAHLNKIVLQIVEQKYSDVIRAAVEERMTDAFIGEFIDKAWSAIRNRF